QRAGHLDHPRRRSADPRRSPAPGHEPVLPEREAPYGPARGHGPRPRDGGGDRLERRGELPRREPQRSPGGCGGAGPAAGWRAARSRCRPRACSVTAVSFEGALVASAEVLVSPVDRECVLLDLRSQTYFGLDEVGFRLWTVLTGSSSIEAAYQELLAEYEVEPAQLRSDLEDFVGRMLERGLLVRQAPPGRP